MISRTKKFRKRKGLSFSLIFGLIVIVIFGFLVVSNFKMNKKRNEFNSQLKVLSIQVEDAAKKNQELKEKIAQNLDEDYLEEVGRTKLNLKKPGEEVVVIKKGNNKATVSEEKSTPSEPQSQNWFDQVKNKIVAVFASVRALTEKH